MNRSIKKFYPSIIIVPGEIILDHMEANNMNQKELALRLGLSKEHLNKIIKGHTAITIETAMALESVFGMPSNFWLNLEINHQENLKRRNILNTENEENSILNKIPYAEICKRGWLEKEDDQIMQITQLRSFFRVNNLININNVYECAFRVQQKKQFNQYAQAAWIANGENEAIKADIVPFNKKKFEGCIQEIKKATLMDGIDSFKKIKEICANVGVALIIEKELNGTFTHGVTKWLTPDKVMIIISLRGSFSDVIWFSLFHELGHALLHGKKFDYSDVTENEEEEADEFSSNTLIPLKEYLNFVNHFQIDKSNIISFAKSVGIEAGVVVGRLAHDKKILFSQFSELRRRYKWNS
ncbi:MAG: HigA family addiction module antidote protein [Clostridia bacterium]|nr:HigA family addiction module antidote protein [Clostridia bacterium]